MNDKTPLRELKGVGEKTEKLFQKIGITTAEELLRYYPRTYDIYEEPVEIASAEEDKTVSIRATIATGIYINQIRNLQVLTTTVTDASGRLPVAWFNAPYLRGTLKKGSVFILRGKIIRKKGRPQMEHPEIFTPAAYEEIIHSMQPVYGLTKGLSNKMITKLVHQILDTRPLHGEYLPEEIRERYQLADANYAIRTIHFPKNMQELLTARKRLVFDEFLLFVLAIQLLKEKTEEAPNTFPMKPVWTTEEIIEGLPYDLTGAQKNVWHEIERDLSSHKLMSRLVQGDVGSGKTVIAFLAMVLSAENGFQSALMVPTEVLANQHYEGFLKLMEEQNIPAGTLAQQGENLAGEGKTPLYFALDGKALGIIAVADQIKPDSAHAIARLHELGIQTALVTGDHPRTAQAVAKQVGIDQVRAGVLPADKAAEVQRLSQTGTVAMVGDGINDAPALTSAEVGIAIGAGADIALDAADVVLMKSSLQDVVEAVRLSRRVVRNIKENLFWAFIYNVIGIPIAAGVFSGLGLTLNPMLGAAAMSLSSVCVVSNALRLNRFRPEPREEVSVKANDTTKVESEIKKQEEPGMNKTMNIEGMMCAHCKAHVEKALNDLPGVQAVVDLDKGTAAVTSTEPVEDAVLKKAVEDAGYTVKGIQ